MTTLAKAETEEIGQIEFDVIDGKLVVYEGGHEFKFETDYDKAELISRSVKHLDQMMRRATVWVGLLFKVVRDEKLYIEVGSPSFESWIEELDLGIERGSVYRYIKIVEKYLYELGLTKAYIEEQSVAKLDMLAPYITKHNKEELLSWLRLSRSDIISYINEVFKGKEDRRENALKAHGFGGVYVLTKTSPADIDGDGILQINSTKVRVFLEQETGRFLIKT